MCFTVQALSTYLHDTTVIIFFMCHSPYNTVPEVAILTAPLSGSHCSIALFTLANM